MKRIWLYAIGALLVIAAAVGLLAVRSNSNKHADKTSSSAASSQTQKSKKTFSERQACTVFTLADAKQVLGDSAKGGDTNSSTSSNDLAVSTCSYTQDSGSNVPVSSSKSASLLVRAPKTGAGITSNQNQFGYLKPAESQHVDGYGDNAYWDPQFGQLNILKNNTWYIVSNGPITPSARTLDQAKQLADLLIKSM